MSKIVIYLCKKGLRYIIFMISIYIFLFFLIEISPVNPLFQYFSNEAPSISEHQKKLLIRKWNLDLSTYEKFFYYLKLFFHDNFGYSWTYNRPVIDIIKEKLSVSIIPLFISWILSGVVGSMVGIISGIYYKSKIDKFFQMIINIFISIPSFWIGIILLTIFSVYLKLTPICCSVPIGLLPNEVTFYDKIWHMILPITTMTIIVSLNMAIYIRKIVYELMSSDFILYAKIQGESLWGIITFHLLKHIATPFFAIQFTNLAEIIGLSIIIEQVFSYPGLGQATILACMRSDISLLLGISFFCASIVFMGNCISEYLSSSFDYRIERKYDEI